MKFINKTGKDIPIKRNESSPPFWTYARAGEIVDIPEKYGKIYGLTSVKAIESKTGKTKIETKIKSEYTKEELIKKAKKVGFENFRNWAKTTYKVTGRSINGLIDDIILVQQGKKKPEVV